MDLKDLLTLTYAGLTRDRMRGALTVLGIAVGVASIIVMAGIGEGSRKASEDLVRSMGTNVLMILPGSSSKAGPVGQGGVATLTEEDAEAIRRELPDTLAAATPAVRTARPAIYEDNNWIVGTVLGVNSDYPAINPWPLEEGRYFNEQEIRSQAKVCVLGKTVQANLFPSGEDPVGKTIRIGNLPFEVIGVLSRKGGGPRGDQDDTIQAPYTTVMHKIMGRDHIQAIAASAVDEHLILQADTDITALLRQRHHLRPGEPNDFSILHQEDWIQAAARQSEAITLMLTLAAAISLIVGGVGISNIMLVNMTDRTQEIGLRRALGATRRSVLSQFLIEAVALSLGGGTTGVLLGFASVGILQRLHQPALIVAWSALLGLGSSMLVGVAAGFFPALKASRLDIIEAMSQE